MKVLLRVVLILLLVFVAVRVGMMFAPRLAQLGSGRGELPGSLSVAQSAAQPDWGGGRVSVSDRSPASIVDSIQTASGRGPGTRTHVGSGFGVVLQQKPDSDYAITMAVPVPHQPGRTALVEIPSSAHFRKELLPGAGDAEPPEADIPLYPRSRCKTQVGKGTACFIGFYMTTDSIEAVRSFYVAALGRQGWQRVAAGQGPVETFTKRKEDRTVVVQMRKQDSVTTRIGLVATSSGGRDRNERK